MLRSEWQADAEIGYDRPTTHAASIETARIHVSMAAQIAALNPDSGFAVQRLRGEQAKLAALLGADLSVAA